MIEIFSWSKLVVSDKQLLSLILTVLGVATASPFKVHAEFFIYKSPLVVTSVLVIVILPCIIAFLLRTMSPLFTIVISE